MQSLVKLPKPLSKQFFIQSIVLLIFILWTFLLGVKTWNIQHSCTPLQPLNASVLSERCGSKPPPPSPPPPSPPPPPPPPLTPNIVGLGVASIAMGGLAIAGAPVVVVAGVGIAVWFIVKSAIEQ